MGENRLNHIDLLKSIAIFFVILYHSTLYTYDFLADGSITNYLIYFIRTILSTCVPLFFFANGYLLFNRKFNLSKHIHKIIKLVTITIIWALITLFFMQLIKNEWLSSSEFFKALLELKLGWINHLWYMGALVCIYILFPLLKNVYDTNIKLFYYFITVTAILTFGNVIMNQLHTLGLSFILAKPLTVNKINFFNIFNPYRNIYGYSFVYFCIGGIAYKLKDKIEKIPAKKRNAISIVGILASCMGLWLTGVFYSKITGSVWDVVWDGYDTIFTFCNVIFIYLLCLNWKTERTFIRTISANTLGIYYIHQIIIEFIRPYLLRYDLLRNLPFNLIFVTAVLLICLAICSIMKKIPIISKLVK